MAFDGPEEQVAFLGHLRAETRALMHTAEAHEDLDGLRRSLSLARAMEVDAQDLAAGSAALKRLESEAEREVRADL